jgi:hypothetical protein
MRLQQNIPEIARVFRFVIIGCVGNQLLDELVNEIIFCVCEYDWDFARHRDRINKKRAIKAPL